MCDTFLFYLGGCDSISFSRVDTSIVWAVWLESKHDGNVTEYGGVNAITRENRKKFMVRKRVKL